MVRAAIFDLDMCIFDTHSLGERILDPVLAPLESSPLPSETKEKIRRVLWTTSLEDVIEMFHLPDDLATAMREAHKNLAVPSGIRTFGDEECLLRMPVYRVLVTSGYEAWQSRKIEQLGVRQLFDEVIIDVIDEPARRKGKRRIFEELMTEHGWLPREVLVVGDNPYSELAAGKALGMSTAQTLRPTVEKADGFDHYVRSLDELLSLL